MLNDVEAKVKHSNLRSLCEAPYIVIPGIEDRKLKTHSAQKLGLVGKHMCACIKGLEVWGSGASR